MLDRDMLAMAGNWYHVGWFCFSRFVTMRRTNNIGIRYSLEPWQVNTLVRVMKFFMAPTHY
ncbi:hypothetical protein HanXRQr2_Chr07g0289761 [Helianthus annuus]|uniref:Uncharacterized protein n=1 Tax=Helianthus annuus TaxID=4232 RepID=A0A9K3IJP2_HELAN|nr:hypothetical protein HanXRQr2_Chr07g0289761 [Helianthus annuus]KAJ0904297.1 hypothetical protein HanPSC8_Chr07g0280471 [Helianthus annuus]